MEKHLSKIPARLLSEMNAILHAAFRQASEGHYQEITDDEVMLSTTWYCNADRGLSSPGIDTNPERADIRKWLDISLPSDHPNKGKGSGK